MDARAHRSFYRRVNQAETMSINRAGFRAYHKHLKQIASRLLLERLLSHMSEKGRIYGCVVTCSGEFPCY